MNVANEALIACVKALGGSKVVGPALWPEKTPDSAQRALLDCLNEDRPQHLTPEQALLIARMARARGCHAYMEALAADLGYAAPVPIASRDEVADLQRQFVELVRAQVSLVERMERLVES